MCTFVIQVVHPAPGNASGTLVNAILHHCNLPMTAISGQDADLDSEDVSDEEDLCCSSYGASVRPGIVHRLDKGTSGLLVVAKVIFFAFILWPGLLIGSPFDIAV